MYEAKAYLLLFLDHTGLSEEETLSPFLDRAEGCCRRCGEQREENDFRVCRKGRVRDQRVTTCRACEARSKRQAHHLAKIVGPPAHACQICRRAGLTELDHCHVSVPFVCGSVVFAIQA
jgi:hypothetical protein